MIEFSEKDLENMIMDNQNVIHEKGFEVLLPNTFRQYLLPSGKKIDILSYEKMGDELLLYIIELKKDKAGYDALLQAYGYLSELLTCIEPFFSKIYCKVILVGNRLGENPLQQFLSVPTETYTYDYGFNGIIFKMVKSNVDIAQPIIITHPKIIPSLN